VSRRCRCALFALAGLLVWSSPAKSADLRITFEELTRLVQGIVSQSKIYLNNAPGVFASTSTAKIGNQQVGLPIRVRVFPFLSSTYGYYVNDISSTELSLTPVSGALRLSLVFETDGPELIGECMSGPCTFQNVLPDIEWPGLAVEIDLVPTHHGGSVSLLVRSVRINGSPQAVCTSSGGFLSQAACAAGRGWATRTITNAKIDIARILKEEANKPEVQQALADGLRNQFRFGPAGEIAVSRVTIDPKSVRVNFQFAAGN
jgi:hypothetical protein